MKKEKIIVDFQKQLLTIYSLVIRFNVDPYLLFQDPMASYDVNGHDDNPMPRYDMIDSNRHGTRCAGEVAAVANNSLCSLGIAYHASVGGKNV